MRKNSHCPPPSSNCEACPKQQIFQSRRYFPVPYVGLGKCEQYSDKVNNFTVVPLRGSHMKHMQSMARAKRLPLYIMFSFVCPPLCSEEYLAMKNGRILLPPAPGWAFANRIANKIGISKLVHDPVYIYTTFEVFKVSSPRQSSETSSKARVLLGPPSPVNLVLPAPPPRPS